MTGYHRYHIETKKAPNIIPHPHRFKVKVKRLALAKLLIREFFHYKGNKKVILSRPCVYGVFSGPIGGFAPREKLCVGCLRCTVQYPEMVQISPNPERKLTGDDYFTSEHVNTVVSEAETGRIPIKGAGYRGKFGGEGWDGMWTDMSEIVRPTRDGIHGREFISTEVNIGQKPPLLQFDRESNLIGDLPKTVTIPIPLIFDLPPSVANESHKISLIWEKGAKHLRTFAILPAEQYNGDPSLIPLVSPQNLSLLKYEPALLEMKEWNRQFFSQIKDLFPNTLVIVRTSYDDPQLLAYFQEGIRIFHLTANYHGRSASGKFVLDLIRAAHKQFVEASCRNEVTLIGSGGIIAAEHVPKAMMCGLDVVALDTPLLVALQAKFKGSQFIMPNNLTIEWGIQRLQNLIAAWWDQLLEILGAMGLREVRRLRGEMGRAMFQKELEKEAFTGIRGYESANY